MSMRARVYVLPAGSIQSGAPLQDRNKQEDRGAGASPAADASSACSLLSECVFDGNQAGVVPDAGEAPAPQKLAPAR